MATVGEPLIEIIGDDSVRYSSGPAATIQKDPSNQVLLKKKPNKRRGGFANLKSKFRGRVCLKSKPAILILIWSFLTSILHCVFIDPSVLIIPLTVASLQVYDKFFYYILIAVIGTVYVFFAILQMFYPLAGYLADVKYGRKKCVISSLWSSITTTILLGLCGFVAVSLFFDRGWPYVVIRVIAILLGIPALIVATIFVSSVVAFNANVIQFGLDQLHDSQTEHLILFIHWYVLLSYVGIELIKTLISISTNFWSVCVTYFQLDYDQNFVVFGLLARIVTMPISFAVICSFFLLLSLCVASRKRHTWFNFLSDSGSRNPYKLVYKVISFSREHSYPIRRSAFTYCEDELPSRLDLGKEKYGGPFTTEQVEDVKAFLGILTVLLSLGPLFAVERSINFLLPLFSVHLFSCYFINTAYPSLIAVVLLVIYTVFLRPLVQNHIPSMLKCIGLGMILMLTPILCFFILDTAGHATTMSNTCFLLNAIDNNVTEELLLHNGFSILTIPITVSICGSMIFYIAIYEFLYSQSPHSMKGLMIGTFFAIRGTFQLLGVLIILFPFLGWKSLSSPFPSCGFVYNLVCIIVAFFGMVTFILIAKRYRNRQRDEPDNIYRYAEEYYEKTLDESKCDSDSDCYYDNLNVHTID